MTSSTERRSTKQLVELRGSDKQQKLGGYALVYNRYSQNLGGFVEMVEPGFVDKSIADGVDVLARYQHDSDMLLGRVASGTLRLSADEEGVEYEVDLPDTSYARDLAALAGRGDVRNSSFAFQVMPDGEEWDATDSGFPLRILKRGGGKLVDVAPVVTPAYPDATAGLRSLAEHRGLDFDVVKSAAAHNQLGELLRAGEPTVIDLTPSATQTQGETHVPLAIHQRRLQLLAKRALNL